MVFNATCNNILVVSWCSVLLVEETEVPRKNQQPVTSLRSQSVQIVQKKLISLAQQRKSHWCNSLTLCEKHPNIHVLYIQLYFNEVYICLTDIIYLVLQFVSLIKHIEALTKSV
jgi:hypothetical protein